MVVYVHFTMEEKPYASLQIQAHNLLTRVSLPGHVYLSDRPMITFYLLVVSSHIAVVTKTTNVVTGNISIACTSRRLGVDCFPEQPGPPYFLKAVLIYILC